MGRTRTNLRQSTVRALHYPLISGTSDSSGNTISSLADLRVLDKYADDALIGLHLYLSSGTPTATDLMITDSTQSTGLVSFRPTIGAAPDSLTYEVLPFSAPAIHQAIDDSLLALFDQGLLVRDFHIVGVTGSPLYNGQMEYWTSSSVLDGWTATTVTLARQQGAGFKWTGDQAARLSTAAGTFQVTTPYRRFLADFAGGTVRVRCWMTASGATGGRVQVFAQTITSSSYHSGTSLTNLGRSWELLTAEVTLLESDVLWYPRIDYAAGNVDVAEVWVEGGHVPLEHPIPIALMPGGPSAIYISPMGVDTGNTKAAVRPNSRVTWPHWTFRRYHDEAQDVEYGVILWTKSPPGGMRMVVEGSGPITLPTADTSVVEVNQFEAELIAKWAARRLLEGHMANVPGAMRAGIADHVSRLTREIDALMLGYGAKANVAQLPRQWPA